MLPIPDTPTFNEWIALIQQDADRTRQYAIALQSRLKKQSILADPAAIISAEDYNRAQRLLSSAVSDPQQAEQIAHMVTLGQATLAPYPEHEDWLALIQNDPSFAKDLYAELEAKSALLESTAPLALKASIDAYLSIISQQRT